MMLCWLRSIHNALWTKILYEQNFYETILWLRFCYNVIRFFYIYTYLLLKVNKKSLNKPHKISKDKWKNFKIYVIIIIIQIF